MIFPFSLLFSYFFLLNVNLQVLKDATQGSEAGKTISLYVLDALICIDHERFFLSQLQSRGFLRSCFMSISNVSYQVFFLSAIFSQLIHDIFHIMHYSGDVIEIFGCQGMLIYICIYIFYIKNVKFTHLNISLQH